MSSASTLLASFAVGVCATLLFDQILNLTTLLMLSIVTALLSYRSMFALPLLSLLLGLSWASLIFSVHFNNSLPSEHEGQTIQITGSLMGIPDVDQSRTKFDFEISQANTSDNLVINELKNTKVVLSCYRCRLSFEPNQQWNLFVRLKRPHGYASWGAFDYEKYLFRHEFIASGYIRLKEANTLLSSDFSKSMFSINQWRWQIRGFLNSNLDDFPTGKAILLALMIGDKSELSNEHNLVFQKTGINHLMAISGLHIGLAFLAAISLLKLCCVPIAPIYNWVPRQRLVLLPALVVALFYAAMAGFAISTQRAIIMLSVFVIVRLLRREVSLFKVLLMAVVIIFIYDPFSILDIGFWLSCLAVFIIALVSQKKVNQHESSDDDVDPGKQSLSLIRLQPTLWLGMLPATVLFFGKISLISPFINLLLVPLFCVLLIPATLVALLLKIVGLLSLSKGLLVVLAVLYEWGYQGLNWLAALPFAQSAMSPMTTLDYLLFIAVGSAYYFVLSFRHYCLLLFLAWLFFSSSSSKLRSNEYDVTLLDVGQGLAMVVEAADYVLVYDTGPAYSSGFNAAEAVLIPYLHYRGIKRIDTLIVSHADNDHIGGFPALEEAFQIDEILTSRLDKIPQAKRCRKGQHWSVSDIHFRILSPDAQTPQGSNNHSCVLMVSNGSVDTLISGDIEKQVERYLLQGNLNLSADILLVPHQGSKTSSTVGFVDAVSPDVALVAAGYRNHYGHPHPEVVSRYKERAIELYSTVSNGSILLNIKENNIEIASYRTVQKSFWHRVKKPT